MESNNSSRENIYPDHDFEEATSNNNTDAYSPQSTPHTLQIPQSSAITITVNEPLDSHQSSYQNGVPLILVSDSDAITDGQWHTDDIVEVHGEPHVCGSPTGSVTSSAYSKSTCHCDLEPPHEASPTSSTASLSELKHMVVPLQKQRSLSHGDIRPLQRDRSQSDDLYRTKSSSEMTPDIVISTTRFCASQSEINEVGTSIGSRSKKKLKKMFLSVDDAQGKTRKRSASTDAAMYSPEISPQGNRMAKFFRRLRSHSQGEIIVPHGLKAKSSSNIRDDVDTEYGKIPATAINTSLLSKLKKHIGKQPNKKTYRQTTQRRNSDYLNNNENVSIGFYDAGYSTDGSQDGLDNSNHLSPDFNHQRERSNSETPRVPIEIIKPKKKGLLERTLVTRFKDRNRDKKRDRSGSLPNVLDDENVRTMFKNQHLYVDDESRSRSGSTQSDRGVISDKTVFMGDFAIDDYFSENGESLSLENLVESDEHLEKSDLKNKHSKYSWENMLNILRGKSRSMDYTMQRPFDLETLKRKLGERTSSEPSRDIPDPADVGVGGRGDMAPLDKKGPPKTLLSGPVISYTVQANDTLMSIAARFDTTPSELTKMNRLSTRFLFPGQILTVPDKGGAKENLAQHTKEDSTDSYKDSSQSTPLLTDLAPPKSPQSGGSYPRTPANSVDVDRSLDKDCLEKFLKIQVRHITDGQGVVAGVLLVTPNAVMFDPNVSDPLVIERGSESYGVIAPMDFVVSAALYYDIAHMKVKDTGLPKPDIPKPEIYYGPSSDVREENSCPDDRMDPSERAAGDRLLGAGAGGMGGSEESPSKEGTFPELGVTSNDNDNDSSCSCGGDTRETSAFPKAFEHELLTPISSDASPTGGGDLPPTGAPTATVQAPFVQGVVVGGDLAPIVEGGVNYKEEEEQDGTQRVLESHPAPSPTPAKGEAPRKAPLGESASLPPLLQHSNDKKRTTSVTFSTSSESDMPPLHEEEGIELPSQESRKQKVLKRISYPLSWMESFADTKDTHHQGGVPSSAPPSGNWIPGIGGGTHPPGSGPGGDMGDANRQPGMFSNVFSMSNVSNMLTRRTSLDFVRRPPSQGGEHPHTNSASASPGPGDTPHQAPQSHKRAQFKDGPKFGLKSMVSMEDMPDLFASFDKLIPKPATASEESPLYLCLRMGTPIDRAIPRTTPIMTYGRKTMRPEYWFSIPKNRTDELFHFFQIWASEVYGELDEEVVKARGFELIEEEIEIWPQGGGILGQDGGIDAAGELKEMTKESWEVVSMSEELRKALYSSSSLTSLDIEVFLPEIQGKTELVDDYIRKNMYRKLPARVQGYNWKLVFSSAQHGFSLKSLYRKMNDIETPTILFIQDTNQNKFGAFLSCPLRVSELFYGTGESFLFICSGPEFQVFPWTGENTFFVKGNNESLYIGGGDGKFGIWLDGDLYQGRTQCCKTFGNPVLTDSEDFIIKTIECWYFD